FSRKATMLDGQIGLARGAAHARAQVFTHLLAIRVGHVVAAIARQLGVRGTAGHALGSDSPRSDVIVSSSFCVIRHLALYTWFGVIPSAWQTCCTVCSFNTYSSNAR